MQQPSQAIKLSDDQRVTSLESLEALRQRWPLDMRSGGLVREDCAAPCPLQGSQLQIGILIIRGDATIADFHRGILALMHDTHNLLFLQD
jgi:hypothetical protein